MGDKLLNITRLLRERRKVASSRDDTPVFQPSLGKVNTRDRVSVARNNDTGAINNSGRERKFLEEVFKLLFKRRVDSDGVTRRGNNRLLALHL